MSFQHQQVWIYLCICPLNMEPSHLVQTVLIKIKSNKMKFNRDRQFGMQIRLRWVPTSEGKGWFTAFNLNILVPSFSFKICHFVDEFLKWETEISCLML